MHDLWLVLTHIFNWRFLAIFGTLLVAAYVLPEKYLKPFRSVRFNIWLFLVLAVVSSIGTFFPMQEALEGLYHTWWFSGLLALMSFDVLVCKLRKWPHRIHGKLNARESAHMKKPEDVFVKSKQKAEIEASGTVKHSSGELRKWLEKKRLSFHEEKVDKLEEGAVLFVAGRHRVQRWGDFILHISIVVALAGSLMGALFGFEEFLPIQEGTSLSMKNRPYEVTLEDFVIEHYETTGAPSLYASDLTVKENGNIVSQKKIVVNEPMDIKRVRFYQASWGMTTNFKAATLNIAGQTVVLPQNEVVKIKGTPFSIRGNEFLPSFELGQAGQAETHDFEGKNPALQLDFLVGDKLQGRLWVLKNNPHVAYKINGDKLTPTAPPPFRFLDIEPLLFSGIQVGYDPGAPLFWTGSIFLLLGLSLHFYFHQRRLRILLLPSKRVLIGGWNSRAPQDFEREFSSWVSEIRKQLA